MVDISGDITGVEDASGLTATVGGVSYPVVLNGSRYTITIPVAELNAMVSPINVTVRGENAAGVTQVSRQIKSVDDPTPYNLQLSITGDQATVNFNEVSGKTYLIRVGTTVDGNDIYTQGSTPIVDGHTFTIDYTGGGTIYLRLTEKDPANFIYLEIDQTMTVSAIGGLEGSV